MGDYRVTGGTGGLTVEYEELEAAGHRIQGLAEQLGDRAAQLHRQAALLASPAPAHALAARLHAVALTGEAVEDLRTAAESLEDTARGVVSSVRNYLAAEGRLRFGGSGASLGAAVGLWGLPGASRDGQAIETLLGSPLPAQVFTFLGRKAGSLERAAVLRPTGQTVEVNGAASFLSSRSRSLQDEAKGDVFEIIVHEGPEGKVFIVTLPGTQSEGELFDVSGISEATTGGSTRTAALVADALRQAGAAADDAVVLNGYSQGGIHAANAAGPLIDEGFDVRFVMTAGAPTGDIDTPMGVTVVHVEHGQDWVPASDGTPNPDTPDRTTVIMEDPVVTPEGTGKGLGPGHRLDNYEEAARVIETAPEQSLQDSMAVLRNILGTAGGSAGQARVIRVEARRVPPPAPPRPAATVPTEPRKPPSGPPPQPSPRPGPQPVPPPEPPPKPRDVPPAGRADRHSPAADKRLGGR